MIRLTALPSALGFVFLLERDGDLLLSTDNRVDLAEHMLKLGIDNPLQLIDAAENWGVVDIRDEANPDRRRG